MANSMKKVDPESKRIVYGSYYKFMMYRNPVERLLSGYRSKVESYPLFRHNTQPFNQFRLEIYNYTQPQECQKWLSLGGTEHLWISFPQFVDYWLYLMSSNRSLNDHFSTIFSICKPCEVRYNYYGNFKDFNRDAEILLKHQGANLTLLKQSYYEGSGKTTREIAPEYYRQLSDQQKHRILESLALDLKFYYNLFPEEQGSHKTIMDTNYEVPTP